MNTLLAQASKWFTELEIENVGDGYNRLKVNRDDLQNFGGADAIVAELKQALNCKKFFWSNKDDDWFYLEVF